MTVNNELPHPIPTSRVGIVYGYVVCLIAMGIALVGLNTVISRVVDLSFTNASGGEWQDEMNWSEDEINSFRAYKQQVLEQRAARIQKLREQFTDHGEDTNHTVDTRNPGLQPLFQDALRVPSDQELQSEYTQFLARRSADKPARTLKALNRRRYEITRDLVSALQLFFTGAILFILHWRWVQRRIERVAPAPALQEVVPVPQEE